MTGTACLQVAEVLADLAGLNIADEEASHALVSSHLNIPQPFIHSPSQPSTRRSSNATTLTTPQTLRRLTSTSHNPPPLRTEVSVGTITEKRLGLADQSKDVDLHRAAKLVDLFELKDRVQGEEMKSLVEMRRAVEDVGTMLVVLERDVEREKVDVVREDREWREKLELRARNARDNEERRRREREARLASDD